MKKFFIVTILLTFSLSLFAAGKNGFPGDKGPGGPGGMGPGPKGPPGRPGPMRPGHRKPRKHLDHGFGQTRINKTSSNKDYVNYRGERKALDTKELTVSSIKMKKSEKDTLKIEVKFSDGIDPLSVEKDNISVAGAKLDVNSKITFNKTGDSMTIEIPENSVLLAETSEKTEVTVEIDNIKSFDGKNMKEKIVKTLSFD